MSLFQSRTEFAPVSQLPPPFFPFFFPFCPVSSLLGPIHRPQDVSFFTAVLRSPRLEFRVSQPSIVGGLQVPSKLDAELLPPPVFPQHHQYRSQLVGRHFTPSTLSKHRFREPPTEELEAFAKWHPFLLFLLGSPPIRSLELPPSRRSYSILWTSRLPFWVTGLLTSSPE